MFKAFYISELKPPLVRKIINDPVHGFITIEEDLVFQILAHPAFQRLRRIKQMALAYLVYPGAVHTRLHHALGAYHLMGQAIEELNKKNAGITPNEALGAKLAILLHDIGHGPFSHALEHTLVDVHHESLSLMIMEQINREFGGQLDTALAIFKGTYPKKFLHQLVSSQLDTDRLDYLARDSFFTGVSEGVIGYDRIIKMLTVHNDELVVEEKGVHSIEKYLIARRLMYWQVYLHKTVLASELMLVNILNRARALTHQGHELFATPAFAYFLKHDVNESDFHSNPDCLHLFLQLDDTDIISAMKVWSQHSDPVLADLCRRLNERRLFKVQFISPNNVESLQELRDTWTKNHPMPDENRAYYWMEDSISNSTYTQGDETIRILFKNNTLRDITQVEHSLISEGLLLPVKKHYICYLSHWFFTWCFLLSNSPLWLVPA